eukprot:353822-Chlamydomonas_euryale.AAC.6
MGLGSSLLGEKGRRQAHPGLSAAKDLGLAAVNNPGLAAAKDWGRSAAKDPGVSAAKDLGLSAGKDPDLAAAQIRVLQRPKIQKPPKTLAVVLPALQRIA